MKQYCTECVYATLPYNLQDFNENKFIFLEGDKLSFAYIIEDGLVKVSKLYLNGEEKIFDILGPGEFLALVAALRGDESYVASAVALTPVKLRRLKTEDVTKTYEKNNQFKDLCINCAMSRTNMFQSQLFHTQNQDTEEKIIHTLQFLSVKFGRKENDQFIVNLPFSKTHLANLVGIRRETLSRKLSSMQKEGLIEVEKNIYKFYKM